MSYPLTPRLVVSNAAEAISFYKNAFNAREVERFATPEGTVVHSAIDIDGAIISIVDEAPDWGMVSPERLNGTPVFLTLELSDPDAVAATAEKFGATIVIPVDDRFYGRREGRIKDPFGHLWILGKEVRKPSPEEIQRGVDSFGS